MTTADLAELVTNRVNRELDRRERGEPRPHRSKSQQQTLQRWSDGEGLERHAEFLTLLETLGVELRIIPSKSNCAERA